MKGRILFLAFLFLIILLAVILIPVSSSQATGLLAGKAICLDPGHGGPDPGATNGLLLEKSINMDVYFRIKQLLSDQGAVVFMTREDDDFSEILTNSDRYTYCNERQAEHEEEMILVSVHTNSVVDDSWDGTYTLYGPRDDPALAQAIHDRMLPYLRETAPVDEDDFRDFGVSKFASGILFKSDMPAAMVEPLFMSNEFEAPLLGQTIYTDGIICVDENPGRVGYACRREQIAQAVFEGIKNYFAEPQLSQMHVSDIDMRYQSWRAFYFITTEVVIQDENSQPLSGATVEIEITRNDDLVTSKNIITDDEGLASYKLRSKLSGSYTSTVIDVSKIGVDYDSEANVDIEKTIDVP
jgi:N-acetylmuramoyl-L-alanine amidase